MAWLSNYSYRKSITLSRASGAVTNYQMKLLVGESSGATGEDVDCGGLCLSTFNDIRFTKSDGTTLLDYWIESISGTTPNQLATIWIEFDSIGTSATTFYMYYGKADATAVSNGANTFIAFDDFERGVDGDTIGGDWTEEVAHVHISTEKKYSGTRSVKITGAASPPTAKLPVTASENIAVQMRIYKETLAAIAPISGPGNGSKRPIISIDASENVTYYDGSYGSAGNITADTWQLLELCNYNYSTGTFDVYVNNSLTKAGATMYSDSLYNNAIRVQTSDTSGTNDFWFDNVIVRNWFATEPAWGAWGTQEDEGSEIIEAAEATDEMVGILMIESTSESASASDLMESLLLVDSISESAEVSDIFGNEKTAYGPTVESAEVTDLMDALHLVDYIAESAVASDSMEAAELIRKRIRFPNLQGKHLSLKFESSTDGSFALYYLRHKMFKTRELTSDQKHPNTQGSHIGIKLSNSGSDAFTLMYVSEKMQLVTT